MGCVNVNEYFHVCGIFQVKPLQYKQKLWNI